MPQDTFLPRCHPHMLGEDGRVDLARCEDLAADMADLREMGIILTLVGSYAVGANRYSNLRDALAAVHTNRADRRNSHKASRGPLMNGH
ncbi:hypothetical protein SAMN06297468_1831 [Altererythrobacter xiamenensis]|uniref:Uncharacterized protein n=1 Tax=Altererythrobacter xiamenensis TaxID=1316679 RepID=A0A1Y6F433_9SPHN|nr:hypothetical protein SAMN06297468_1831 [Altererythrobacter xiamenensis]